MNRTPTKEAIEQVMAETGMEYIQARNHLIQRYYLQDKMGIARHPRAEYFSDNVQRAARDAIDKARQ